MKVLLNSCYGGFSFSEEFVSYLKNNSSFDVQFLHRPELRHNEELINHIENFGIEAANGICSRLEIVHIYDGAEYFISEYDGYEDITTYTSVSIKDLSVGLSKEQLDIAQNVNFIKIK